MSIILSKQDLSYGGISLLIATVVSILFIKFSPFYFNKLEIFILQLHIFVSIFLGTTLHFYKILPNFDFYLHLLFGIVSSILTMPFLKYFIQKSNLGIKEFTLSFIIFIIFCFSTTCGAIWEIYEFSVDKLLNLNTQNNSLLDTMTDIIANTIGSIIFCIFYLFKNKEQAK